MFITRLRHLGLMQ